MKKVPTWRVILGSIVLTTGIVASHSMRFGGVESAEAAPAARGSTAHGGAGAGSGSGMGSGMGSAMGSDAGSGAGSASHAHKPVKHSADSPGPDDIRNGDTTNPQPAPNPDSPVTPPPSSIPRNPTPVTPGSPGPTGPIAPGTTPTTP